jgi:c(7)-type cytochrome triheme protein
MRFGFTALASGLGLSALVATLATGAGLPRLPQDYAFPQSPDSPGVVVFSHQNHVDAARPSCTSCHPRLFRMLTPGSTAAGAKVVHKEMEAGHQCGACHNGKDATGFDNCETCHRTE